MSKQIKTATSWPESWMCKSDKQKQLEENGCVFRGQERLDNHELDLTKECYCGRSNKTKQIQPDIEAMRRESSISSIKSDIQFMEACLEKGFTLQDYIDAQKNTVKILEF